jgi:imidazoleglycerol-phosphate dehydratase
VAGLDRDLVSGFLRELAEAAGLTLHVRLLHGEDARHVLEAIFKALGAALADASAPQEE